MIEGADVELLTRLYRNAENKGEQILILAELTATNEETIINLLKDQGMFKPEDLAGSLRTCSGCGRKYIATTKRGRAVCPDCAFRRQKQRDNERYRERREATRKRAAEKEGQRDGVPISKIINKIRPAGKHPGKHD